MLPATRDRAGAAECKVDVPVEIAPDTAGSGALGMGTKIVYGPKGGLVAWKGDDHQGKTRPLGRDGKPTGAVQSFPTEKSFSIMDLVALDDGFVAILNYFEIPSLKNRYFVQPLSLNGEARGAAVQLPFGDHFFEGASEAAGGRFIVLAGPNQAVGLQAAKALVVRVDAAGNVQIEEKPLAITAPPATRPAVSFAVTPEHWAMTVQVAKGQDLAPINVGGQTVKPVAIKGLPPIKGNTGKLGGIEALVVDGEMKPIRGASAGTVVGPFSANNRYSVRWAGDALGVSWVSVDDHGVGHVQQMRMALDGQLQAATAKDEALKKALQDVIQVETISGGGIGTTLTRVTQNDQNVGEETHLDRLLPELGREMVNLDVVWSGDRFVIAHEIKVSGKTVLRTVGMRCDGK